MNRLTCPIWECLKPEQLAKLILVQWKLYGTRLELLTRSDYSGIENLEELTKIMRQKPHHSRGVDVGH